MRKSQRSYLPACAVVFLAQLLSHAQASVGVLSQKAQKVFALHEVYLARIDSLRRQFIRLSAHRSTETQDFSRLCDLQNQGLTVGRANGELDSAFAQHKNAARGLALDE